MWAGLWLGARRWALAVFLLTWPGTAEVVMAVYVLCMMLTPHCTVSHASACGTHQTDSKAADGLSVAFFRYQCTTVYYVYVE